MLLSSTMYADASYCLKRFSYRWIDHLVTKPRDMGVPLRRGIWLHKCLEEYHQGHNWISALVDMVEWASSHGVDEEKVQEIYAEVKDIMQGYIDFYASAPTWEVLGAEIPFIKMFSATDGIRATTDLPVHWEGEDWIVEHKSTSEIPPASWRSVDPQTALQYWLCHNTEVILNGRRFLPVGIIFNYLLTKKPAEPRWKKDGTLYANATPTTTAAFERGYRSWADTQEAWIAGKMPNIDADRTTLVNDALFYRRFPVMRPEDNVRSTMQDILATLRDVRAAEAAGWYRRSFHVLTCRRFCPYADICVHEYQIGKESLTLREELFQIDTGERGEGR